MSVAARFGTMLVLLLLAMLQVGCFQFCYIAQAAHGQDEIAALSRPLTEVLKDKRVPPKTRDLLARIDDVKRFSEANGLQATNNYTKYADLDREAAVWVVTASLPLRFQLEEWSFPFVGSVPYLGWFNRRDAHRFADELRKGDLDVDVRRARAYSTLGWFDDPVLSTMIRDEESALADLVNTIIHESVHATHYVNSQTLFNESLASFVADKLTVRFLRERPPVDPEQATAFIEAERESRKRKLRYHQTYVALDAIYQSKMNKTKKLKAKAYLLEGLRFELGIRRKINNATLAQSRAYHGGTPLFDRLLRHCNGDMTRFFRVIMKVGPDSFARPQQIDLTSVLEPLLAQSCDAV